MQTTMHEPDDMTTWNKHYSTPPHRLHIEDDQVRLESLPAGKPPALQQCTGTEFLAGTLNEAVLDIFDVGTLAEAHAVLCYARLPRDQRAPPIDHTPLEGRPEFERFFGDNIRGKPSSHVWFFGRTVAIDIIDQPRLRTTLEAVSQSGLSPAHRQALGDEHADAVERAARALEPLPCMCGTGCQTADAHDALQILSRCQVPDIPVDHDAMTCRCTVCGRWWTFVEVSAFRYSPRYSVYRFRP